MKKRIGTPEEIARTILEMGERHLVIYCHPEDLKDVQFKVAHPSVLKALEAIKQSSLRVEPNDICWREEYIMAKAFSFEHNPWEIHCDSRLMVSYPSIPDSYSSLTLTARGIADPTWNCSTDDAIKNINDSLDYIKRKSFNDFVMPSPLADHLFDDIIERNNRHQLMMETYQFKDSLDKIAKDMREYAQVENKEQIFTWAARIEALSKKVNNNG